MSPSILRLAAPARDYPAIRDAAWRLLQAGHISDVLKASYAHLIVDEYQDCSVPQHHIVCFLSLILPRNARAKALGHWLLEARRLLAAAHSVDLRTGPPAHVTWFQAVPPNDHAQRLAAARTAPPTADARVLIIADSRNRAAQQNFASQTPGASTVEAVDLQDLIAFANRFDVASPDALGQLLALAQSVMTNVGVPELNRRLESASGNC